MGRDNQHVIQTVLCATDFSETAEHALRHAMTLARRHQARLVLVHIIEPLPADPYPALVTSPTSEVSIRRIASARLRDLADEISQTGLRVDSRLEMGPPGPQLVEIAAHEHADLIVVGTRGLTGFKHLVFGSVAEHVVRRAQCPVLTVHPNDPDPIDALAQVILPTDLSEDAEVAAEVLLALYTKPSTPHVTLVYADPTPPYLDVFQHEQLAKWHAPDPRLEELEERLAPMVKRLRQRGFEVEVRILDGDAVEAITSMAEERGADLIVMSTHGRSALLNALLGRTAQRVVQHASCPVLTVRPARRS